MLLVFHKPLPLHLSAFVLAAGQLFVDSKTRVNPLVFFYKSRPLPPNICPGVELALATMKEGGSSPLVAQARFPVTSCCSKRV